MMENLFAKNKNGKIGVGVGISKCRNKSVASLGRLAHSFSIAFGVNYLNLTDSWAKMTPTIPGKQG